MNLIEADRDCLTFRPDRQTGAWIRSEARKSDQTVNHFLWRLLQRIKQKQEERESANTPEQPEEEIDIALYE